MTNAEMIATLKYMHQFDHDEFLLCIIERIELLAANNATLLATLCATALELDKAPGERDTFRLRVNELRATLEKAEIFITQEAGKRRSEITEESGSIWENWVKPALDLQKDVQRILAICVASPDVRVGENTPSIPIVKVIA